MKSACTIRDYEEQLDQAKAGLAHIAAAIAIFEGNKGQNTELPAYADMKRLFRHGGRLSWRPLSTAALHLDIRHRLLTAPRAAS
jgi:hypothetical protein